MNDSLPEPIFLSAPKAATLCGVSRNTICCWIREGKLPSYRTAGGKYLIRPEGLTDFMEKNDMFVPPALQAMAEEDRKNQNRGGGGEDPAREPAILIVDDDENMRELISRTLKPLGLPMIEAEDGYDALHQLTRNPLIALVVLDLIMPGQGGAKTFMEIRQSFPSLPVIVCTGQSMEDAESMFQDLKPDLILTKPFQPSHLSSTAATFLEDLGF